MPYEIDLTKPPEGECGLLVPDDNLAELERVCAMDGDEIVADRNVWMRYMQPDGYSKVNLRQFGTVYAQTGPSCGSAGTIGAAMCLYAYNGLQVPRLSIGSLFSFVGSRMGSTLSANIKQISDVGCVPESMWPSSDIYRRTPPAGFAAEAPNWRLRDWDFVQHFAACSWRIFTGRPVIIGVNWGGTGHIVFATRVYKKPGTTTHQGWGVEIRNSWGTNWGDQGHGILYESQVDSGIRQRYGAAAPRIMTATEGIR
jgi:hypothetical protein